MFPTTTVVGVPSLGFSPRLAHPQAEDTTDHRDRLSVIHTGGSPRLYTAPTAPSSHAGQLEGNSTTFMIRPSVGRTDRSNATNRRTGSRYT
ncbi:hypothetical protein [Halocatena pleomorpha]|uniref:Uncharacterized protein n=1 Tax=Halocatena pleomorpha TaxID=1785090 RepID=A0A3P3RBP3_9EURY|nr:hypothetical protein [Halocatena pleomorpha]RRJ30744.1 hypothetical protein EIK79_08920 [Halocatena pleomorpha]